LVECKSSLPIRRTRPRFIDRGAPTRRRVPSIISAPQKRLLYPLPLGCRVVLGFFLVAPNPPYRFVGSPFEQTLRVISYTAFVPFDESSSVPDWPGVPFAYPCFFHEFGSVGCLPRSFLKKRPSYTPSGAFFRGALAPHSSAPQLGSPGFFAFLSYGSP